MSEYIYLLHPLSDNFFDHPTPEQNNIMENHFDYLKKAAEVGKLLLAGPCLDNTFGIVIFMAVNDDAAHTFMFNDPCIKNNVMMAELHPMRISVRNH